MADNGGQYPDLHPLTHALQTGSPALNKAVTGQGVGTDERGVARPQGAAMDFGAYEKQ